MNKQHKVVSMLQAKPNQQIEQHRTADHPDNDDNLDRAVVQAMATMHEIQPRGRHLPDWDPHQWERYSWMPLKALLDMGSSISIVSLDLFLNVAVKNRLQDQDPEDWGRAVRQRLRPISVSFYSYEGEELNIVSQVTYRIGYGNCAIESLL